MKTEIEENGNQLIAKFIGRLDTPAAAQTTEEVKPFVGGREQRDYSRL